MNVAEEVNARRPQPGAADFGACAETARVDVTEVHHDMFKHLGRQLEAIRVRHGLVKVDRCRRI
jgi:hypothetical protein